MQAKLLENIEVKYDYSYPSMVDSGTQDSSWNRSIVLMCLWGYVYPTYE